MSIEHQNICSTMKLEHYKPNDVIVKQGDPGDSFFYILTGTVNIRLNITIDTGIKGEDRMVTVEKSIGVLKAGQTFGELALLYGTPRSATIVSVTNSSLIKIEKEPFDKYVKNIFENQLQDQIEFLKICPVFHKIPKESLIKLAVRTERKKFSTGQVILKPDEKSECLYIIRRGTVKVTKRIQFIRSEKKVRGNVLRNSKKYPFTNFEDMNVRMEYQNEKVMEQLALGPTEEDIKNGNCCEKDITLETLKIGDIFPSYYCLNGLYLDVTFEANNPCDVIVVKLADVQEIGPDTSDFIKKYAKPYPDDEFLRKFYYYNEAWMKYRNTLKYNILADALNRDILQKNKMRSKLFTRRDIENVKLPEIFSSKRMHFK